MSSAIRITTEADGIVVLWLDTPGKSVNTFAPEFLAELAEAVTMLERQKPPGVVITSAKPKSFSAGADLFALRKMSDEQVRAYIEEGQALFERIARLSTPTVAAINGDCLGGGCELALACRYRVAADNPAISIGLPEVKLGLIPAWGGTTRLPRIIGLTRALPILLAGKTMPPKQALRAGILDEVVRPEALIAAAKRLIRNHPAPHHPGRLDRMAAKIPMARNRVLATAVRRTHAQTRGNYPAPPRLLDVLRAGYQRGFAAGLEAERQGIAETSQSDAGRNLMRLFFLRQGAKQQASTAIASMPSEWGSATAPSDPLAPVIRAEGLPWRREAQGDGFGFDTEKSCRTNEDAPHAGTQSPHLSPRPTSTWGEGEKNAARDLPAPADITHAAVIGGGTMGSGIVHALIRAGIAVRLVEVDPPAVSAALGRIARLLEADVSAGRLDKLGARHAMNRVSPTIDWSGLELADIVIEAVLETMPAKREVFSRLDRATRPHAVLATNTSSLLVSEIAQTTLHQERVIGLHFFNPVAKMPLVEIVRTPHSDALSLATAIALAARIGKTPIVVNDSPGFLVNRILIPYLAEALLMAAEGHSISVIDESMKDWGMPMGPFELLDEIGLDIAAHVLDSLSGRGAAAETRETLTKVMHAMLDQKFLGKKSGAGFYLYPAFGKGRRQTPAVNEVVISSIAAANPSLPEGRATAVVTPASQQEIQWRLVLPMINEAARALAEHVTDSTDAIDLASVLGFGLAPFRGGLMQYANALGMRELVGRLSEATSAYGPRFTPAPLLRELAAANRPLESSPSPPQPTAAAAMEHVS